MRYPGLFVTGTDTGAGKTQVSAALAYQLSRKAKITARKPVASGCRSRDGNLASDDAQCLYEALQHQTPQEIICPYRFAQSVSPARAARLSGVALSLETLVTACRSDDFVITEGAGGFLSPIAEGVLNADLARALNWPVILVAADRLGAVNHVLLSLRAIHGYGLSCLGVVLNRLESQAPRDLNNAEELQAFCGVPLLTLPYMESHPPWRLLDVHAILAWLD